MNLPEVPDVDGTKFKSFYHPEILGVTVPVLVRPQSVGDTLDRVNDRAGEIVGRIDLPLITTICYQLG